MNNMFSLPNWLPRGDVDGAMFKPDLQYDYEIIEIKPDFAKSSGNPIFSLNLKIHLPNGTTKPFNTSLSLSAAMNWLVLHFFDSCGASKMWDENKVNFDELRARTGRLIFKTEEYQGKKSSKIKDFVKRDAPAPSAPPATAPFKDDDIPW